MTNGGANDGRVLLRGSWNQDRQGPLVRVQEEDLEGHMTGQLVAWATWGRRGRRQMTTDAVVALDGRCRAERGVWADVGVVGERQLQPSAEVAEVTKAPWPYLVEPQALLERPEEAIEEADRV